MARVTVFGLGEAGSALAADLAAAGHEVHGFDPLDVPTPPGVVRHEAPGTAVAGSSVVLAVTAAVDAQAAIAQAWNEMKRSTLYADCSTAPAHLKQDLADTAALRGLVFADVALMSTVPGRGLATPALACGPGGTAFAEFANSAGGSVEYVGVEPGVAATRKLLRSVVMKGLAGLVIEATAAAEAAGEAEWFWDHLTSVIDAADAELVRRLVDGTAIHASRRRVEMEAAENLLDSLDVEPVMTRATVESLRRAGRGGPTS